MAQLKMNQQLKNQIDELILLTPTSDAPIIFKLDKTPFNEKVMNDLTESKERLTIGRIFPNSDIFKEGAFQIEIKTSPFYPFEPPKVRFITPIHHPNVNKDGEFRHELLQRTALWTLTTSLLDVVKTIVERIDHPDIEYSQNPEVAHEYVENRTEFNRKALEMVKKHALT